MDSEEIVPKDSLFSRIDELEERQLALMQEKKKIEEDFGFQRAKLKELFVHKEEELQNKAEENSTLAAAIEEKAAQIKHLHIELEAARSQATIAQCTAENEVEIEKRKCVEEVATLRQLMKEELGSAHNKIYELKEQLAIYDAERRHYKMQCEQKSDDRDLKKNDGRLSSGVLTAVRDSLAKKVSLSPAHSSVAVADKSPVSANPQHSTGGSVTPNASEQPESMEDSMKRAQEDTTLLKSLLVPLEEEISALKDKIRKQDAQLQAHRTQEQMALMTSDVIGPPLFQGKTSDELVHDLDEKICSGAASSSTLIDPFDALESEIPDQNGEFLYKPSKFSPEKLPQLTDDQKHALSVDHDKASISLPLKSEVEWAGLQSDLKRSRECILDTCQSCAAFEAQLKKAENEFRESEKKKSIFENAIQRQKEELERESQYRKTMEHKWKQMAEEFSIKEKNFQAMTEKVNQSHAKFLSKFRHEKFQLHEYFKKLSNEHESIQKELLRLQKENDSLVGKHSQHSQEMQNEIINLPDSMEEMQLLLLKYREDIIAAKVAKENTEDKLKSEILFLKNQVLAEQHENNSMESRLMTEIDQLRENAGMVESLQENLATEKDSRSQAESRVQELEKKSEDSRTRSQQFITGLKKEVEDQKQAKKEFEAVIVELKNRIASLQQDLRTSEAVQRDFVRLSQQLQVQLEKIRQSGKEVRWQHEEDIDECNNCNQRFTTVGRRKHHCRHCGKIFCSDCVSKNVVSGPNNRNCRVCDVCHTLLVQDATPFFSTEPPQSPD